MFSVSRNLMEDFPSNGASFLFETDSVDVFNKINSSLEDLQSLIKNVWKFLEKLEELLSSLTKLTMSFTHNHNHQKPANSDYIKSTIDQPSINSLHEIAGLKNVKDALCTLMILPRQQPQLFQNRTVTNSILLYGPPGTGKTRLVHGLAAESGAVLHSVSASDLLSLYLGDTEKIKTELMCQMNKIEHNSNMVVMAATNCPWDLDSAILRRFQKCIYVPLPNSQERNELFKLFTENIDIISTPEELEKLIQMTEGFSGSDISSLVRDALDIPLVELQGTKIWVKYPDGFYLPFTNENPSVRLEICLSDLKDLPSYSVKARPLTASDLLEAAKHVQVTVKPEDLKKYELFRSK